MTMSSERGLNYVCLMPNSWLFHIPYISYLNVITPFIHYRARILSRWPPKPPQWPGRSSPCSLWTTWTPEWGCWVSTRLGIATSPSWSRTFTSQEMWTSAEMSWGFVLWKPNIMFWFNDVPELSSGKMLESEISVSSTWWSSRWDLWHDHSSHLFICLNTFKGQQDLKEVVEHWKQNNHIMAKWFKEDYIEEKPKDFIGKFLAGHE